MKQAIGNLSRWGIQVSMLGCLLLAIPTLPLSAEELQPDVNAADTIRQTLDQQVGKRAKVKLRSGQELDGKVLKVGSNGVYLAELTGMEFYEARDSIGRDRCRDRSSPQITVSESFCTWVFKMRD